MTDKRTSRPGSTFWQIIFPTLAAAVLFLLAGIWVILYSSPGNVSRFAEISTVLLVIPVFFMSLLGLLLLGGLIALVLKIIQGIPPITIWILDILEKVREIIRAISKNLVKPVIEPASYLAGFRRIFRKADIQKNIELEGGKDL
jgi:hypothetical protein